MGWKSSLKTTPPAEDVILYDGHCRLCQEAARWLRRLLGDTGVVLRSFREEAVLASFPGITLAQCEQAMQLVLRDGSVYEGAEAIVRALARRPVGKLLLVYYLPGLKQLVDVGYRLVARYRFRIAGRTCDDQGCALYLR